MTIGDVFILMSLTINGSELEVADPILLISYAGIAFIVADCMADLAAPDEFKLRWRTAIPGFGIAAWAAGKLSRRSGP